MSTISSIPEAIPISSVGSIYAIPKTNIVFSFDTTGSMAGALGQIRREIVDIIDNLFDKIPGISIGIIAHGDYGDRDPYYLIKSIDITSDKNALINFVQNTGQSGGNWYAAYDKVLKDVQLFTWTSSISRSLVMIGDSIPREKGNITTLDWRNEVNECNAMGINIYSVQCLDGGCPEARTFYKYMASKTNGYHLYLDQFSYLKDIMTAICYKQLGNDDLERFENRMVSSLTGMTKNMRNVIDIMLNRTTTEAVEVVNASTYDYSSFTTRSSTSRARTPRATPDYSNVDTTTLVVVPSAPSRFQVIDVPRDMSMKEITAENMITFKVGRGFYEFTKPELISKGKEIVMINKNDGFVYEGLYCRHMINLLNYDPSVKIKPATYPDYIIFIQSTSATRKLVGGTKFLYDIST